MSGRRYGTIWEISQRMAQGRKCWLDRGDVLIAALFGIAGGIVLVLYLIWLQLGGL